MWCNSLRLIPKNGLCIIFTRVQFIKSGVSPSALVLHFWIQLWATSVYVLFPAVSSETLTGKVYWVNQMGNLPFVGMNSDACTFTTCPIQADSRQTYEYQLSISRKFPVVSRNDVCPSSGVCRRSGLLLALRNTLIMSLYTFLRCVCPLMTLEIIKGF
jgi:hypothetical protein